MARGVYYVNFLTTDTGLTTGNVIVQVWNPSSTRTIALLEYAVYALGGTAAPYFTAQRSSARGTATQITITAEHHSRRQAAPDSAFTVDHLFTVEPTLIAGELLGFRANVQSAAGVWNIFPRGLEIPPGTGFCLIGRGSFEPNEEIGLTIEER